MASRWRQRESTKPSTWRQSLLFNSLLLLLPVMASQVIQGAYTSDIATDPMGLEARTETRQHIEDSFRKIKGSDGVERAHWALRVEATIRERDFSAARGYLLAAPLMLDRKDAQAVLAAAEAEESGTQDQRLARAALLFLPDTVHADYERAVAPPQVIPEVTLTPPVEEPSSAETAIETATPELVAEPAAPANPFTGQRNFDLLGDPTDLTRQSQRWIAGDPINSLQLRLRALGLMQQSQATEESLAFANAASVLRAAHRTGRLNKRFETYISNRVEAALPEALLRDSLGAAFGPVLTTSQRTERIMVAYRDAIDPEALERLSRDMQIIARLVELTSSSGALTLIEQAASPEDMRRALLITEAGGERSVALARELGPKVLDLAQIGVKWTRDLVLQVMALMALGMALLWTALSAFTQAETIRPSRR